MHNRISKLYGNGVFVSPTDVHSSRGIAVAQEETGTVIWVEEVYPNKGKLPTTQLQWLLLIGVVLALTTTPVSVWLVLLSYVTSATGLWLLGSSMRDLQRRQEENDSATTPEP